MKAIVQGRRFAELDRKPLGPNSFDFTGAGYVTGSVMPNFYFHVTTAYNILRHCGVDVGKRDFLGAV